MTKETERRAIAFIRTIAGRCSSCTHRREELCRACPSRWANEIMRDYEAEMKPASIDYSLAARKIRVLDILNAAGRPLAFSEIDLSSVCTRQAKAWTLDRMAQVGLVERLDNNDPNDRRIRYLYSLPRSHKTPKPNRSKNANPDTRTSHGAK